MKYKPLTLTPVNFSLTEGTSIPAPLDSPPATPRVPAAGQGPLSSHPTPRADVFPHTQSQADRSNSHDAGSAASAGHAASAENALDPDASDDAAHDANAPYHPAGSLSPTSPSQRRPSSVRKFLGLRTLSSSDSLNANGDRPSSPALTVSSQKQGLTRKKSTSWFGRRKSSAIGSVPEGKESKETTDGAVSSRPNGAPMSRPVSMMPLSHPPLSPPPQSKPRGPPPPALPELKSLGVSNDSLSFGGEDLFKDIK